MSETYELSKYDFAIALAAIRYMRKNLELAHQALTRTGEPTETVSVQLARCERLIDRLDQAHTGFLEIED
jgi:hypothetical protein